MPAAAFPANEAARLEDLRAQRILDTPPEAEFDELTQRAMEACGVPVARISFVDENREWFKSRRGIDETEAPRQQSFCAHALHTPGQPLIVPDATQDPRFADNPNVAGGAGYRFYAGFPIRSSEGHALGTLCVLDHAPRQLSPAQSDRLRELAQQISARLSLRHHASRGHWLQTGFAVGVALLLCMGGFFVFEVRQFLDQSHWVSHTHQVIGKINRTLSEVQKAESAQRGYTDNGTDAFLASYRDATQQVPAQLAALRQAVTDNPAQLQRSRALETAIAAKEAAMATRIEQRRARGPGALDPASPDGSGHVAAEAVDKIGYEMIGVENTLLRNRSAARTHGLWVALGWLAAVSLLGVGLLIGCFLVSRRQLRQSQNLSAVVAQVNLNLESEVAERRRAQRLLSMQHAVARIAARNLSLGDAAPEFLQSICEHLDWEVGECWTVQPTLAAMRLTCQWHTRSGDPAQAAANAAFVEASRPQILPRGEGLPGRTWESGAATWETDLEDPDRFLRVAEARAAGFRRGFAFPLRTGSDDRVTEVMLFLNKEPGAPEATVRDAMDTLAGQIAQFTERCRAEARLHASQARFSAFIENAPALAYIKDAEGRMVYGNGTLLRTFNLQPENWIGKTDADFWPDSAPALRENDRQVLATGVGVEVNETVPLPDGRTRHWLSHKFPLPDEATGGKLLAGISIDITAHEEAENLRRDIEEAERVSRSKSEFLSRVSHELRTPLNAILGFGQLLQTSVRDEQDAEALRYILKAGTHLLGLVDEVLDLSKAESGELQLHLGNVALGPLADHCLRLTAPLAQPRGVTCKFEASAEPLSLQADEKRLRQILLHLLANAVKYNREQGSVSLRGERRADGRVRVSVSDTGPGLSEAQIQRLFVPFERLEATAGKAEGVGLGLVVSRRLARSMGGDVGVQSTPGAGSTFWVEIPEGQNLADRDAEAGFAPELMAMLKD